MPTSAVFTLPKNNACVVCRRRKLKCDAGQPGCSRCHATGQQCEYRYTVYKSRTQLLQERISELESQIRAAESRTGSSVVSVQSLDDPSNQYDTILLPDVSPLSARSSYGTESRLNSPIFLSDSSVVRSDSPRNSASPFIGLPPDPSLRLTSTHPEPPPDALTRLLRVFMQRKIMCGFELHIGRVMSSFQSGAAEPMVSALFNSMLLLAAYFAKDPDLKALENRFLARTKWEIETNIARAHGSSGGRRGYNALYHLQAMFLLGQYFYLCGRMLEGYVHMTQAVQFAVTLGIHRLDSRMLGRYTSAAKFKSVFGRERWQPRDPVELGEAINLWWVCALRDLAGAVLNGLPPSVAPDEITTVWPVSLSEFENGGGLSDDNYSAASLLDPKLSYMIADASQGSVFSILCKACIIMYTAGRLDTERMSIGSQVTEDWWERFEECNRTMERFMGTVPPVHAGRNIDEVAFLATIHTAVDCGTVQLHGPWAGQEFILGDQTNSRDLWPNGALGGPSYTRCVEACRNIGVATTHIEHIDLTYIHMFIGVTWVCAAEFMARYIPLLRQAGHTEQAGEMEQQLMVMERAMEKLLVIYPVLSLQAEKLRGLRTW